MSYADEMFGLEDKVALVTGAGRGIGRAVAIAYAKLGADIALSSRTQGDLDELAETITKLGRRAIKLPADVGKIDQLPALVETTVKELGRIDILVNNAARAIRTPLKDAKVRDFDRMHDVNVKATMILSQAAIPHMKKQGNGKIINVTSMAAVRPELGSGIYGMTKASIRMFTRTLAAELAWEGTNIQVNCVGPGAFATSSWTQIMQHEPELEQKLVSRIPIGRVGHTDDIVGSFIFLASRAADYVTGISLYPDGGWLTS